MSDMDWTLSYLSSIAGQITTSSGEGVTTRHYAWASPEMADYWLHSIVDDNGKQGVIINEFHAPSEKMYAVFGYCVYHDIQVHLDESLPEEITNE